MLDARPECVVPSLGDLHTAIPVLHGCGKAEPDQTRRHSTVHRVDTVLAVGLGDRGAPSHAHVEDLESFQLAGRERDGHAAPFSVYANRLKNSPARFGPTPITSHSS